MRYLLNYFLRILVLCENLGPLGSETLFYANETNVKRKDLLMEIPCVAHVKRHVKLSKKRN